MYNPVLESFVGFEPYYVLKNRNKCRHASNKHKHIFHLACTSMGENLKILDF